LLLTGGCHSGKGKTKRACFWKVAVSYKLKMKEGKKKYLNILQKVSPLTPSKLQEATLRGINKESTSQI